MPLPPKRGRNVYVRCPGCGENCRAKFRDQKDGPVMVSYVTRRDARRSVVRRIAAALALELDRLGEKRVLDILRKSPIMDV